MGAFANLDGCGAAEERPVYDVHCKTKESGRWLLGKILSPEEQEGLVALPGIEPGFED
jgi:hypothetical protein